MNNTKLDLQIIELKTYIPAENLDLSVDFYNELGFSTVWNNGDLVLMDMAGFKFLLQRFYKKEFADNFVMHLLVNSADDWWQKLRAIDALKKYETHLTVPEDREWGIRDFTFLDPSGVLWRVGNAIG